MKYLKANGIQTEDKENLSRDLKKLEAHRTELTDELEKQDIDPALIGRIQYCIKTVMEAGEIPEHQMSILEKLEQPVTQKTNDTQEQKSATIKLSVDKKCAEKCNEK